MSRARGAPPRPSPSVDTDRIHGAATVRGGRAHDRVVAPLHDRAGFAAGSPGARRIGSTRWSEYSGVRVALRRTGRHAKWTGSQRLRLLTHANADRNRHRHGGGSRSARVVDCTYVPTRSDRRPTEEMLKHTSGRGAASNRWRTESPPTSRQSGCGPHAPFASHDAYAP